MIWVSWYKKAAKILHKKLPKTWFAMHSFEKWFSRYHRFVAVDEKWSGLKLVIPVKDRKK